VVTEKESLPEPISNLRFFRKMVLNETFLLKPPREADVAEDIVWKLRKVVYGLNDASHNWYSSIQEKLLHLGYIQSSIDKSFSSWRDSSGQLAGMFIMHVEETLRNL